LKHRKSDYFSIPFSAISEEEALPFGRFLVFSRLSFWYEQLVLGAFFIHLIDKPRSKGHYHWDRLSSSHHRLLNLPDMRQTMQRWQSAGRSVGPAFTSQAVGEKTLLTGENRLLGQKPVPMPLYPP
jgi:hypothetical protein